MLFTLLAWFFFIVGAIVALFGLGRALFYRRDRGMYLTVMVVGIIILLIGGWFQTHTIVRANHVAVFKNTITQEFTNPRPAGFQAKPFFADINEFPYNTQTEDCRIFTPSISGGIGITMDLCFYIDTTNVDWRNEIDLTGRMNSEEIMSIWRNSIVSEVAKTVKIYSPQQMNANRYQIEADLYENVLPWFNERGIPLIAVSFRNWDFTSEAVSAQYDTMIKSQARIAEQEAMKEAAVHARERQLYEAETAIQVAEKQAQALEELGLEGNNAVMYMWTSLFDEQQTVPNLVIMSGGDDVPVAVPAPENTSSD